MTDFEIFIQGIMMRIAFDSMVNCACVCVRVQLVSCLRYASGMHQGAACLQGATCRCRQ